MTSTPPGDGRRRPYAIRLDADGCGTMLGALVWVMGALEIMKDRAHAVGEEEWHEVAERLMPHLERLVGEVGGARTAAGNDPTREAVVEASYTRVREAFEAWIQVAAADTVAMALQHRVETGGGETPAAAE